MRPTVVVARCQMELSFYPSRNVRDSISRAEPSPLLSTLMRLRPWHVIVCVVILSIGMIVAAYNAGSERAKDILLGVGVNLLSSIVFFVLLETYWRQMKRTNGKEVDGFDYSKFARNVARSKRVRVLGTFIYPFTEHPNHAVDRQSLLQALRVTVSRPAFVGVQILFLHPASFAARSRAEERKDDDVLLRMAEALATLSAFIESLEAGPTRNRVEVRLFSRMPPFSLFQTDNFGSISFFYRDRPVSEVTRYEFFIDSPLGGFVEKTFDDLWLDEKTVTLDDYFREKEPN